MMNHTAMTNGMGEEEGGFLRRHRPALVAGCAAALVLGAGIFFLVHGGKQTAHKVTEFTMVKLLPPPPPPPPPQEQPVPKMIEQPKMVMPEQKPTQMQPQPKLSAPPTGPLGLDAKGEGPGDAFNLAGNAGGNGLLGGGGSRWGWYAGIVQDQVGQILRSNDETRRAEFAADVEIWADAAGKITRVRLKTSTGNATLDRVIEDKLFAGVVLREAPPSDMPMPIVLRSTGRHTG
jgi:hypothetical protein